MNKILFSFVTSAILFLSPNPIFSQTVPNLNSADSFVLFTANGNFTASGFPIVVGNVGNAGGTATAFPPGFLSGAKHFGDATATQASTDITNAYNDLGAQTCGTSHAATFGAETLTPGVYCATGNSTLVGTLTLDGQGSGSSVFIIKVNGNLVTNSGSQIVLINGASSCNVFWQVNGTVDLNNTVFRGNILANGAANLTANTFVDGRVLTTSGNFTFGSITVTTCAVSLLPLKLVDFEATKAAGNNVQLSWITASENNVLGFDVEASVNGGPFVKIGSVLSQGNEFPTRYNFQDLQPNKTGVRFYRLKMIDRDGSFTYSFVRSLKFSDLQFGLLSVFPNPASNKITLSVNAEATENVRVIIANTQGQKIMERTWMVVKGINTLDQDVHNLSKSTYIISIKNISTGSITRQSFQKL